MKTLSDVDVWSIHPRRECPASVVGSFNASVEILSVAAQGALTRLGWSSACRWEGDAPSTPFAIPDGVPRVLIVYHGAGNAPTYGRLYVGD